MVNFPKDTSKHTMKTEHEVRSTKAVLEEVLLTLKSYDLQDDIKRIEGALVALSLVLGDKGTELFVPDLLKATKDHFKRSEPQQK